MDGNNGEIVRGSVKINGIYDLEVSLGDTRIPPFVTHNGSNAKREFNANPRKVFRTAE